MTMIAETFLLVNEAIIKRSMHLVFL